MMNFRRGPVVLLAAAALASCSSLGGTKKDEASKEPNAYPANYRTQITNFLRQSLTNRSDFRGAFISPPTLQPVGAGQRYVVCVRFNPNSQIKTKVAIYFADMLSQFIDATPEQCGNAAYQPFNELEAALPKT